MSVMLPEAPFTLFPITLIQPIGVDGLIGRVRYSSLESDRRLRAEVSINRAKEEIGNLLENGGIITRSGEILVPNLSALDSQVIDYFKADFAEQGFGKCTVSQMRKYGFSFARDLNSNSVFWVVAKELDQSICYKIAGAGAMRPGVMRNGIVQELRYGSFLNSLEWLAGGIQTLYDSSGVIADGTMVSQILFDIANKIGKGRIR